MSIEEQRSNLKNIVRTEMTAAASKGSVEAIIGLDEINYNYNLTNDSRLLKIEQNETIYQVFSFVGTSTSGTVEVYTESSIFDIFGDGVVDAIVLEADGNNNPKETLAVDSGLNVVHVSTLVDNLNGTATYSLSATPITNSCIVYFLKVADEFKENIPLEKIIPPSINIALALSSDFFNKTTDTTDDIDTTATNRFTNDIDKALALSNENYNGNGIIAGFNITINGDTTKIDISAGIGFITDNQADVNNPTRTKVIYAGATGITPTYLTSNKVSYLAIDVNGDIIQQATQFTNNQRRDYILLGAAIHSNLTTVNATNNLPDVALDSQSQINDLIDGLGNFNKEGNIISANGANLSINKSAGLLFKRGVNFSIDPKNPHIKILSALTAPANIRYRMSDGTEYADTNVVSAFYESPLGTRTVLGNNNFSIQRITIFSSNLIRIQYGQAIYNSLPVAIQAIQTEIFTTEANIAENGLLRCFLIFAGRTTSLLNTADAIFIEADKFGALPFGSTGGTTSLQQAYSNSVIPQITTTTPLGAVTIKRGSVADTDNILALQNGAGDIVSFFTAEGFKEIRYRDEYAGGAYVAPGGAAAPDLVAYTIGGVQTTKYSFDGGVTEERISNAFEMPHDLDFDKLNAETEFIEVHVHWRPSTNNAGNVEWFFDYSYDKVNSAPVSQTSLTALGSVSINQQYYHKITSFVNGSALARLPKPAAGFNLGDIINFTLRRTPAGTNDTYPDDTILEKVALHVPINDRGSRQLYIK